MVYNRWGNIAFETNKINKAGMAVLMVSLVLKAVMYG